MYTRYVYLINHFISLIVLLINEHLSGPTPFNFMQVNTEAKTSRPVSLVTRVSTRIRLVKRLVSNAHRDFIVRLVSKGG